jgi:hypothetical protein
VSDTVLQAEKGGLCGRVVGQEAGHVGFEAGKPVSKFHLTDLQLFELCKLPHKLHL